MHTDKGSLEKDTLKDIFALLEQMSKEEKRVLIAMLKSLPQNPLPSEALLAGAEAEAV